MSAGADPYHFGGHAASNDLVDRLLATERGTGTDRGLFGSADPSFDGTFRQGLALAALSAARVPASRPGLATAIGWLRGQQCANGLWQSYRADTGVACPAADPASFSGPDTNSTSLAAQGLASYQQFPQRARLLASLHAVQNDDGGFGYLATAGQSSDPDSTALISRPSWPRAARRQIRPGGVAAAPRTRRWPASNSAARRRQPTAARSSTRAAPTPTCWPRCRRCRPPRIGPCRCATHRAARRCRPSHARPRRSLDRLATTAPATADRQALTMAARAPLTGTAGPCSGTTGVTVTVDFTAFAGVEQTRCATGAQTSGITALQNAGFTPAGTTHYGLAFVCRINNLPSPTQDPCVNTPPPTAYWAYYHALAGATTWSYSSTGASSYKPPLGSIDAWAFGNGATPSKTPAQVRAGS